jgi:hypothetical protein
MKFKAKNLKKCNMQPQNMMATQIPPLPNISRSVRHWEGEGVALKGIINYS